MASSFVFETAIKLHCYRVYLIPWVKRSCKLSFTNQRFYSSSSFPVKYTSKKSANSEEIEVASLTSEEKAQNRLKINNVSRGVDRFDNTRRFFDDLDIRAEEEMEGGLMAVNGGFIEEGDELVEDSYNRGGQGVPIVEIRLGVEKSAIEMLAARAFTAQELKKKLQGKNFPPEVVDDVITDFQSRGLINDSLYAETYSRSRWSSSSWGPRRIKQALYKKGVSEVDSEKAIKLVFENHESSEDEDSSGTAMSKLSFDQLYVQASKQWLRSNSAPRETRKSRIVRWLQYRGFNWNVIKSVLKKLESEHPS